MYSNGIMVEDVQMLNEQGILSSSSWIKPDTLKYQGEIAVGEAVYRAECLRCHQIQGYNAIVPLVRDWNSDLVITALNNLDQIKGFMPPFIGTDPEKNALAAYLMSLTRAGGTKSAALDSLQTDSLNVPSEEMQP
jgi:mono/diheme cytochrome c family protein